MKISVVSDNHGTYPIISSGVEVIIVAGDVGNHPNDTINMLQRLRDEEPNSEIIFVPGNHDLLYSYASFHQNLEYLAKQCELRDVKMLYNATVQIADVKFYGTTLWSNLQSYGPTAEVFLKRDIRGLIADFENDDWSVNQMLEEFDKAYEFLGESQWEAYEGKKFVVTHFAPSLQSVAERFKNDILTAYFCNDLDHLTQGFDFWVHGHTHTKFDYQLGDCRVVCNPIGYRSKYGIENPLYKELIIET